LDFRIVPGTPGRTFHLIFIFRIFFEGSDRYSIDVIAG